MSIKQTYTTPELFTLGKVEDLTKGQGVWGNDDLIFVFGIAFQYGTDPSQDVTSG